jgi:hypothetical protein
MAVRLLAAGSPFAPTRSQPLRSLFGPRSSGCYDDQRQVHRQIFEGDNAVDYAFMCKDPNAADNQWLRKAMENRIPVIWTGIRRCRV